MRKISTPLWLFGAMLFGVLIRYFWTFELRDFLPDSDFSAYLEAGQELARGKLARYMFYKGPGVSPIYGLFFWLFDGSSYHHWLAINTFLLMPIGICAIYLLAKELGASRHWRLVAAFVLAWLPDYAAAAHFPANENAVIPFTSLALWSYFRLVNRTDYRNAIVAGIFFGISFYVKALFSLASPFMAAFLVVKIPERGWNIQLDLGSKYNKFKSALIFSFVCLIIVSPWWIFSKIAHGRPLYSMASYSSLVFFSGNQPFGDRRWSRALSTEFAQLIHDERPASEVKQDQKKLLAASLNYTFRRPFHIVEDLPHNLRQEFLYGATFEEHFQSYTQYQQPESKRIFNRYVYTALSFLGILGFLLGFSRSVRRKNAVLFRGLYFYLKIFFTLILVMSHDRHKMAAIPLALPSAILFVEACMLTRGRQIFESLRELRRDLFQPFHILSRALFRRASLIVISSVIAIFRLLSFFPWTQKIKLDANALVGGTVKLYRRGKLADPNPVVAFKKSFIGKAYEAIFEFNVEKPGMHDAYVTYARRDHNPVQFQVNGILGNNNGFNYYFAGREGRFAQRKYLGRFKLQNRINQIRVFTSELCQDIKCGPVIESFDFELAKE